MKCAKFQPFLCSKGEKQTKNLNIRKQVRISNKQNKRTWDYSFSATNDNGQRVERRIPASEREK